MKWIGLFSTEKAKLAGKPVNLLDTLCIQLEKLMAYAPGEQDIVMLQHKFVVEKADGSKGVLTSTLQAYGSPLVGGHSAMALTVGLPCGLAVNLVLDGVLSKPGVHAPYEEDVANILREKLEAEGIGMTERWL